MKGSLVAWHHWQTAAQFDCPRVAVAKDGGPKPPRERPSASTARSTATATNSWLLPTTPCGIAPPSATRPTSFTFAASSSNATLVGNAYGFNTFQFGAGPETATGGNRRTTSTRCRAPPARPPSSPATAGTHNELDFTGGIADDQLWFPQSGNDLRIDLMGTQTDVIVKDWFASSSNQLQEITAGGLKLDSQVSQLVQAMASYSAAHSGFDPAASAIHACPATPGCRVRWRRPGTRSRRERRRPDRRFPAPR